MSRHPAHLPDERTIGQRMADRAAAVSGSWAFLGGYLALTAVWMGLNTLGLLRADPYPFIAYTCAVSVLAIAMSSLILLASNRQAEVDREHAELAYTHINELLAIDRQQLVHLAAILAVGERQHKTIIDKLDRLLTEGENT